MAGVRREPGIVHGVDGRVRLEEAGDRHRVGAVRAHPPRQGTNSALEEPAVEWRRHGTPDPLDEPQPLRELIVRPGHERTTKQVAVAAEILGRGMHDDVGAEVERALEHRRRPGVVHRAARAHCVGQFDKARDVHHTHERVRRSLHPQDLRVGPHRPLRCRQVRHVHHVGRNAPRGEDLAKLAKGAVVGIVGRKHMVAGRQRLKQRQCRGRAGGEGEPRDAVLERGERRLERAPVGVGGAGVDVPTPIAAVGLPLECRGEVNRRRDGARGGIGGVTGADREGLDAHGGSGRAGIAGDG